MKNPRLPEMDFFHWSKVLDIYMPVCNFCIYIYHPVGMTIDMHAKGFTSFHWSTAGLVTYETKQRWQQRLKASKQTKSVSKYKRRCK